jgi:hypothetical protein
LVGTQGFDLNNANYDAGATSVIFHIVLNGTTATDWEFDYIVEDDVVRLGTESGGYISPNPQSGSAVLVTGATSVDLEFYFNNISGSEQTPVLKVTSVTASACTDATDCSTSVIIKAMPEVGSFN